MKISILPFKDLTTDQLYRLLQLRSEVFVVEQNCIYQDIDGKDRKALHVIGEKDGITVACTRIFNAGDYFYTPAIGRIVVKQTHRKYGYGHEIVAASIQAIYNNFEEKTITISAQQYLLRFYEKHGFRQTGEPYPEDGIPHIRMIKADPDV